MLKFKIGDIVVFKPESELESETVTVSNVVLRRKLKNGGTYNYDSYKTYENAVGIITHIDMLNNYWPYFVRINGKAERGSDYCLRPATEIEKLLYV